MPFGSFSQLNGDFYVEDVIFRSVDEDAAFKAANIHMTWAAWNVFCWREARSNGMSVGAKFFYDGVALPGVGTLSDN